MFRDLELEGGMSRRRKNEKKKDKEKKKEKSFFDSLEEC